MDEPKIENVLQLPGSAKGPGLVEFLLKHLRATQDGGDKK